MNITLPGAAHEVTDSCFLVETADTRSLIGCGMAPGTLGQRPVDSAEQQHAERAWDVSVPAPGRASHAVSRHRRHDPAPRDAAREHRHRNPDESTLRLGVQP